MLVIFHTTLKWVSVCVYGFLFSSPWLKAQVSFSYRLSSVLLSINFHICIFFYRTTWLFSTKLVTEYPWVKGIQVCTNEKPRPFPGEDNYEIAKIHWRNFNIFLLQNPLANFNQTWHKASLGEGNSSLFKWRTVQFSKVDNVLYVFSSPNESFLRRGWPLVYVILKL